MAKKLSTFIVAEPLDKPGYTCLLRWDFPDSDTYYIWCGPEFGWLLFKGPGCVHRALFATEDEACDAMDKYGQLAVAE
jgi:hypothetical protein